MTTAKRCSRFGITLILAGAVIAVPMDAMAFSDVPESHYAHDAIMYLAERGILSGYSDNTFKPDNSVNRAEALKMIIAPLVSADQLAAAKGSVFTDVAEDAWFAPYVEIARASGVIDGPPKKTAFLGANQVIKAEFLKMLQLAHKLDPVSAYNEIQLPLSSDVADLNAWFYPYMRFAITSSLVQIGQDGLLHPGRQLSRGDTAVFVHRLLTYKDGRRTQALLSEAENEIVITLNLLDENNITEAEYSTARSLLAARGALTSKPDEPIVQGALKTSEAFRALVRGYRAGLNKDYDSVIALAKEAWAKAEDAKSRDASLTQIGDQIQLIAGNMADEARSMQNK